MDHKLQKPVAEFVETHSLQTDVPHRLLDLISEVGELAKEALQATDYGKTAFHTTPDWEQELGDTLFSLAVRTNPFDREASVELA